MSWYRWDGGDLLLHVRVQPRASRDELGEALGDQLKIRITAPPIDGKANDHLIRFLAKAFGVAKGQVHIKAGFNSRDKQLRIASPRILPPTVARP